MKHGFVAICPFYLWFTKVKNNIILERKRVLEPSVNVYGYNTIGS